MFFLSIIFLYAETNFAEPENVVLRRSLLHKKKATGAETEERVHTRQSQSIEEMATSRVEMEMVTQQLQAPLQGEGSNEDSAGSRKRNRMTESSSWGLGYAGLADAAAF